MLVDQNEGTHLDPEYGKRRQSPFPWVQKPKIMIKQKGRFLSGVLKKVLPMYHVLLQLQVRHFCRQMFRLECEVRTTVTEKSRRVVC